MRLKLKRLMFLAMLAGSVQFAVGIAPGQYPPQSNYLPPRPPPPSPLMFIRFAGPKESKITIYRGSGPAQTLELPCTVGFRPGYSYRLAIFDVPKFPRQLFFPSLEVRGTLALVPKFRNVDFPAQINFTDEEFSKVVLGSFVKKVVVLERPDHAYPVATRPDSPLEIPVASSRDPVLEGSQRGQPLVVMQMGHRFLTPEELNSLAIPGTVLLPGERMLGTPRQPPWLNWNWCPVYDPLYGPVHPSEFVALYNGGDSGKPAGFDRDGKLKGLDPSDANAEYVNSKGEKKLAVSNRIALCVPRFVTFKQYPCRPTIAFECQQYACSQSSWRNQRPGRAEGAKPATAPRRA